MFLVSLLEVKMIPKEIIALAQQTLLSSTGRRNLDELPKGYIQLMVKKISVSLFVYKLGLYEEGKCPELTWNSNIASIRSRNSPKRLGKPGFGPEWP